MANPPPSSQASSIFPAVETKTLPQDVLLEILLRLPVKSLVRFRAVHTSWQSLFQNPNFISAHFRRSNLLRPRKVLVRACLVHSNEYAAFSLSGDTLESVATSEISNEIYLVGPCNGVFCVAYIDDTDKFLLWNPATREIVVLPPPLLPETDQLCSCAVGFGLDPQGGDLKIVRLMVCIEDKCFSAEVYSLKSRCWRKIQIDLEYISSNVSYFVDIENDAYCNGSYHWVNGFDMMLSFDMTREVFEWGKLPRPAIWWKICAGLSGCLSAMTPVIKGMEVWSMVGARDWKPVKRFEIEPSFRKQFMFLRPVWWDNDEVLFLRAFYLCFLNITRQEVREVRVPGVVDYVERLLPYAESLVSIGNS